MLYPIFLKKNRESIGSIVDVLFDSVSKNDATKLSGRDSQGRLLHVPGDASYIGKMEKVRITDANSFALFGERVKEV